MTAPSHSRNVNGVRYYTDPTTGRTAIGIDLDPTNLELARQRIGPLLFNEQLPEHLTETVTP